MFLRKNLNESYSPLYFLASLGNGGLTITMFIYLMFMVPHPETPMITFDSLMVFINKQSWSISSGLVLLAMAGMLFFAYRHFWLLQWNLREFFKFRDTEAYKTMMQGNSRVSLMAIPLTLAISVNVLFAMGATFVPGLWGGVEYLFPIALVAFALVGWLSLSIFGGFFSQILASGSFDCTRNNNLSQMVAIFAFAMVGVGWAAPAAMSHNIITVSIASAGSIFFLSAAILLGLIKLVLGMRAMLEHGVNQEASASLWIIIPILTLVGITLIRLSHGLEHHFGAHFPAAFYFVLTTAFVSIQLLFGWIGYTVMKQVGYYDTYVSGPKNSPGSYALICPGVALFVFGMFFIHVGLVKTGVVPKFSIAYFALIAPLVYLQLKTIWVMLRLDRKMLHRSQPTAPLGGSKVVTPAK